jgi:L-iditol 2-dehydrogenase
MIEGNMKAALMTDIRKMAFTERPIPTPAGDEVRVKIEYVGICGSNIHDYEVGPIGNFIVQPLCAGA